MNIGFIEGLLAELSELLRSWWRRNSVLASACGGVGLIVLYWAISSLFGFFSHSGEKFFPISGKVTLDGKALNQATVSFKPSDGRRGGFGKTDTAGRYEIRHLSGRRGLPLGEYSVEIATGRLITEYRKTAVLPKKATKKRNVEDERYEAVVVRENELVPVKYNESSKLSFRVERKAVDCDWLLRSE